MNKEEMKNLIWIFFLLPLFVGAQTVTGVFVKDSFKEKRLNGYVVDSLIVNKDSTFRLAFYYPDARGSEAMIGKWRVSDSLLILYQTIDSKKKTLGEFKLDKGGTKIISLDYIVDSLRKKDVLDKK